MHYHMPTTCDLCPKAMWNVIKPPPALECRRKILSYWCCQFIYKNSLIFFHAINSLLKLVIHFLGCHVKCHKDHVDREESCIQECKGNTETNFIPSLCIFYDYYIFYDLLLFVLCSILFVLVTVDYATAKDLLVLANTVEDQKQWVQNLSKKVVRTAAGPPKRR